MNPSTATLVVYRQKMLNMRLSNEKNCYFMTPNCFVLPSISLCVAPLSYLNTISDQHPYMRIVGQDSGNDEDLEGELEEDPSESNLEIDINIYPESDYDPVPPSSSFF